jgi:hypothetical protein
MIQRAPEFSRRVPLARIGSEPYRQRIEATAEERQRLSARFDLLALDRLCAEVEVRRKEGGTILLEAEFVADFEQACAVTLEPVRGTVADRFSLICGPDRDEGPELTLSGDEPAFEPAGFPPTPRCNGRGVFRGRRAGKPVRTPRPPQTVHRVLMDRCSEAGEHRTPAYRSAVSLLPPLLFLANYPGVLRLRFPQIRVSNGCSKEEDFAFAPQYASFAPLVEACRLCGMPELRRTQAPTSPVRVVRLLRWTRGGQGAIGDVLKAHIPPEVA